jgi:hypothetical protein
LVNEEAMMKLGGTIGAAVCGAMVVASVAAAQSAIRRAPGDDADDNVGVNIALQVGGAAYQVNGRGTCGHEPKGWIYGTAAKMWTVRHRDGSRSVTLTFWSPGGGTADMFNLYVTSGGKTHQANTVTGKDAGPTKGSGTVTFAPAGTGGVFTVNATSAGGAKIGGTIKCDAFRAIVAEGGN